MSPIFVGDHLWVDKPSCYITSHAGQLNLSIPPCRHNDWVVAYELWADVADWYVCCESNSLLAWPVDGCLMHCSIISSCQSAVTFEIVKCKQHYTKYLMFTLALVCICVSMCVQALRKIGQDFLILMLCVTIFLSYLPEAGEYSSFFVYLRLVICNTTHTHINQCYWSYGIYFIFCLIPVLISFFYCFCYVCFIFISVCRHLLQFRHITHAVSHSVECEYFCK